MVFHVFNAICKRLSIEGKDIIRISDIIAVLNDGVIKLLEGDHPEGLSVVLTLAQIAFEQMCNTIGYTYANWFEVSRFLICLLRGLSVDMFAILDVIC